MLKISVEVETVTATFLGRAMKERGPAAVGWHAAPFRGLARWWLRALVGATGDWARVRGVEAEVFGTADSPSPVMLRCFAESTPVNKALVNPGPANRSEKKYTAERDGIRPGARATIELLTSRAGKDSDLMKAWAALWVALQFGSIGLRCRRGAGSLRVRQVEGSPPALGLVPLESAEALAKALAQGLREARRVLGLEGLPGIRTRDLPASPILHRDFASVRVAALKLDDHTAAGGSRPSADGADESAVRGRIMQIRRAVPGHDAPSEPHFGSLHPRLASPVWVRVASVKPPLVVASLLKHSGAKDAKWDRAEWFLNQLGDGHEVSLA